MEWNGMKLAYRCVCWQEEIFPPDYVFTKRAHTTHIRLFMHVHVLVRLLNEIKANRVCCTKINFICINWRQCFYEEATSRIYSIRILYSLLELGCR